MTDEWHSFCEPSKVRERMADEQEFRRRIRKRVDAWPAWKQAAAMRGLITPREPEPERNKEVEITLVKRWSLEEEKKRYLHAYGDDWEARIEHDGEDSWMWWVAIKGGEYIAEGSVPGSDLEDDEDSFSNTGLMMAKAFAIAIVKQSGVMKNDEG
jgi:hypothetical protein